ncbi:MAG: hypothetical protein A2284_18955 [Deltaproteobacteria bacterium RIFOXYA12_FULL_61_11]|nr:MAG: hypothetical protein A2284_18955 [Deltaproteobacteria bacterium RIFOXYA12_FULL_61_11]
MRGVFALLLLLASGYVLAEATPLVRRHHRPVVLTVEQVPVLLRHTPAEVEAWRSEQGRLVRVRHQLDQVESDGSYALTTVKRALRPLDEFAFFFDDLGLDCPAAASGTTGYRLTAPWGEQRCLYLSCSPQRPGVAPSQSGEILATETPAGAFTVTTPVYRVRFAATNPLLVEAYSWRTPGRAFFPEVVDRMKIRLQTTLLGMMTWNKHEDEFEVEVLGLRRGPVRLIRQMRLSMRLLVLFSTKSYVISYLFYPDEFVYRFRVKIPLRFSTVFSAVDLVCGLDLHELAARGDFTYFSGTSGEFQVLRPGQGPLRLEQPARHLGVASEHGTAICMIEGLDGTPIRPLSSLVYDSLPAPPERFPGQSPGLYFRFTNLLAYQERDLSFTVRNLVMPPLTPAELPLVPALADHHYRVAPLSAHALDERR